MPKKNKDKNNKSGAYHGDPLVIFVGLPVTTLRWILRMLTRDPTQRRANYSGVPSPENDQRNLYTDNNIKDLLGIIERESLSLSPNRIIVPYVSSWGEDKLFEALEFVCFLVPLTPYKDDSRSNSNPIQWRHNMSKVRFAANQTLQKAWKTTNALKAEITDKRISAFTLPANNFYYPNRHSTIRNCYHEFAQQAFSIKSLNESLPPATFTRGQISDKAFKSSQYRDRFFQDCRGRVFPPDIYHARARPNTKRPSGNKLSGVLKQVYRFGVIVRDGRLHYDVQYERQRQLIDEPMYCLNEGNVLVTGSHANVGVNDVIWVPDGRKVSQ